MVVIRRYSQVMKRLRLGIHLIVIPGPRKACQLIDIVRKPRSLLGKKHTPVFEKIALRMQAHDLVGACGWLVGDDRAVEVSRHFLD